MTIDTDLRLTTLILQHFEVTLPAGCLKALLHATDFTMVPSNIPIDWYVPAHELHTEAAATAVVTAVAYGHKEFNFKTAIRTYDGIQELSASPGGKQEKDRMSSVGIRGLLALEPFLGEDTENSVPVYGTKAYTFQRNGQYFPFVRKRRWKKEFGFHAPEDVEAVEGSRGLIIYGPQTTRVPYKV
jgi:hypothetical protein